MTGDAAEFPLSRNQRGLWWDWQSVPDRPLYNTSSAFRVRSSIDEQALRIAFQGIIERHGSFRSSVITRPDGALLQRRRWPWTAPFVIHDAGGMNDDELGRAVRAAHEAVVDLREGTSVDLHLFRRSTDDAVLLLRFHHLFHDFASMDMLHAELFDGYLLAREGRPDLRQAPVLGYDRYVERELRFLASPELDRELAFWRPRLEALRDHHALPTDRAARGGVRGGASLTTSIAGRDEVASFANASRVSRFRVLLSAYVALVHRWSGAETICVGTPTDCRGAELEGVGGNFVNLVPLCFRINGRMTTRELVTHVDAVVRESVEHRFVPFSMLVEQFWRGPSAPVSPFFRTAFMMTKSQRCPSIDRPQMAVHIPWRRTLGGLALSEPPPMPQQEGHFDLSLWAWDLGSDGLAMEVKYDAQRFTLEAAARIPRQFERLLLALITDPDAPIGKHPLMDEEERASVRTALRGAHVEEAFEPAQAGFERAVRRAPDAIAIAYNNERWSYRELDERAARAAVALRRAGVGPGDLVGVLLPKAPDAIAAILGVLRAGAGFLPLDPAYPAERIAFMLEDAKPRAVFSNKTTSALATSYAGQLLDIASLPLGSLDAIAAPTASSLAYVIYTSGSTGTSKGVLVPHRGVASLARQLADQWLLRSDDRLLAFAPLSFDACIADIFPTFMAGATLDLGEEPSPTSGRYLADFLRRARITHVTLPPSVWLSLPDEPFPDLRVGVTAGEACPRELVRRFAGHITLFNNYGPTENTVCVTTKQLSSAEDAPTLGRPIRGVFVRIMDGALNDVPIGVSGELCVGGIGVADGYLGRTELTAEKFVTIDGDRFYRTGDIVRMLPSGEIDYVGRSDAQVKLRGFRIELGEIEDAMRRLPRVADAACAVMRIGERDVLVGFVVGVPDLVLAQLRALLPKHFVPSRIIAVDELPRSPGGKVDRTRLATLAPSVDVVDVAPPANELERDVLDAFRGVLGDDNVGVTSDFFSVGGDSLTAVQVLVRIEERRSVRLAPDVLVRHPTARELARHVERGDTMQCLVELSPATTGTEAPSRAEPPWVLIHAAGGDLTPYRSLVKMLAPHAAVWGLRSPSTLGLEDPGSVEGMAELYLRELRGRIDGEVTLVGWSFGGILAHAMACRAPRSRVRRLVLLDTAPTCPADVAIPVSPDEERARAHAALYAAHQPAYTAAEAVVIWASHGVGATTEMGAWAPFCTVECEVTIDCTHHEILHAPHLEEVRLALVSTR